MNHEFMRLPLKSLSEDQILERINFSKFGLEHTIQKPRIHYIKKLIDDMEAELKRRKLNESTP